MERQDRRGRERGQALPLFVLMLIALMAATGLVVDAGSAWAQERSQQKVADVAAIAGATKEANHGTRAEIVSAALASAWSPTAPRLATSRSASPLPRQVRARSRQGPAPLQRLLNARRLSLLGRGRHHEAAR